MNVSITLIALSPFLYGLMTNTSGTKNSYTRLWQKSRLNRTVILAWNFLRLAIALFFILIVISKSFKFPGFIAFFIAFCIVITILISKKFFNRPSSIEKNFLTNLNAKNSIHHKTSEKNHQDISQNQ